VYRLEPIEFNLAIQIITRLPASGRKLHKGRSDIMANTLQPLPEQLKPAPVAAKRAVTVSSRQFKDFGLLDAGKQSKTSTATAIVINLLVVALVIVLSVTAKKTLDARREETTLIMPVVKPLPPPEPKILPQPKLPTPPVVKVDPPKIKLPDIKPIEAPKPAEVKMTQPAPVVTPAAPKKVVAPPAPVVVSLAQHAASVVNNSPHPTAVALGSANNPITPSNRPAIMTANLGQKGLAGMPASNTGGGPAATAVNLGSGSPGSQQMAGNGVRPVQGVKLGVAGGTGPMNSTGHTAGQVNLGQVQQVSLPKPGAAVAPGVALNTPKVLFKPKPAYTAEATALHINGVVQVRIRVSATGSVTVLAITRPLGHGLDQSAEHAAQAMRFQPAVDANGHPVDWEGNVTVTFQSESNG
jgi:periplasmic protein TonB